MVVAVKVTVKNPQVIDKLNNQVLKLPKDINDSGFQFLKLLQSNLRRTLTIKGHRWRDKVWDSIQARRINKKESVLVISKEGIFLDRAKPHRVRLKRGCLIREWAFQKGHSGVKEAAKRQGVIFVKPHPFIDETISKTFIRLQPILRRRLQKSLGG